MKEKENLYDMEENLSKYRRNNYNAYKRGESLMKFKFKSKDLDEVDDYDESFHYIVSLIFVLYSIIFTL